MKKFYVTSQFNRDEESLIKFIARNIYFAKYKSKITQFYKHVNEWLAEKLRQALNAEDVILTNREFLIVEEYEVTESYYSHQLVQPIGSKISLMEGLEIIFKYMTKKKTPILRQPKYSDVLISLTSNDIHKCYVAYEVLCAHVNNITDNMATKYLKHIASSHLWDYDTFIDIISEEYNCIYNK